MIRLAAIVFCAELLTPLLASADDDLRLHCEFAAHGKSPPYSTDFVATPFGIMTTIDDVKRRGDAAGLKLFSRDAKPVITNYHRSELDIRWSSRTPSMDVFVSWETAIDLKTGEARITSQVYNIWANTTPPPEIETGICKFK